MTKPEDYQADIDTLQAQLDAEVKGREECDELLKELIPLLSEAIEYGILKSSRYLHWKNILKRANELVGE